MKALDYDRLSADLAVAKAAAVAAATVADEGRANLDLCVVDLPYSREHLVTQAGAIAGLQVLRFRRARYFVDPPAAAQARRNTRQAEAMADALSRAGWSATVLYNVD